MSYTSEQQVFIVETYITKKTYNKCREIFIYTYPESPIPTKLCVSKIFKKQQTVSKYNKQNKKKNSHRGET